MGLECLPCGGHSCPPFLPQWEEQGSCLPAWSPTPASLDIFLLVAVFFLSRHHFLRVPSATFLLHWSIKTLMVSPELAHRESRVKKACFLHLGLPFLWFLQCPEPISPHAPPPRNPAGSALPTFRTWALGGETQLSFWDFPSRR